MRCAVVIADSGIVDNVIVATADDMPPIGCYLVELADDDLCGIGWSYVDGVFVGPVE